LLADEIEEGGAEVPIMTMLRCSEAMVVRVLLEKVVNMWQLKQHTIRTYDKYGGVRELTPEIEP